MVQVLLSEAWAATPRFPYLFIKLLREHPRSHAQDANPSLWLETWEALSSPASLLGATLLVSIYECLLGTTCWAKPQGSCIFCPLHRYKGINCSEFIPLLPMVMILSLCRRDFFFFCEVESNSLFHFGSQIPSTIYKCQNVFCHENINSFLCWDELFLGLPLSILFI